MCCSLPFRLMSEIERPRVLAMQQDHPYLRWTLDSLWLKHIYRRVMKMMETAKRGRGTARGSMVGRWLLVGRWLVIEFLKHLIPSGSFVCHVMLVPSDFQAISPSILVQHISNVAGNEKNQKNDPDFKSWVPLTSGKRLMTSAQLITCFHLSQHHGDMGFSESGFFVPKYGHCTILC